MAKLEITDALRVAVLVALKDDYFEGAVETVFKAYPDATRDEVVDVVQEIEVASTPLGPKSEHGDAR